MKKFFIDYFSWFFLFIFAFLVLSSFLIGEGNNFWGYRFFLVQSGSMEPTIMTGDVIIVKGQSDYAARQVITFKDSSDRIVTHRIVDVKNGIFITKGDANRTTDNGNIQINQIIGKLVYILPKLGFMVIFSKSIPGVIIFIVIPGIYIIVSEILKSAKKSK